MGRGSGDGASPLPSHRFEQGLSRRAFRFDLDDLMSSLSSPRPPPMSQARLSEIPKIVVTQEQTNNNVQCSVCFDEFKMNESDIRKLPCNHLFHEKCIFPWLRINGTCPVCRASLVQGNDGEANAEASAAGSSSNFGIYCFIKLSSFTLIY